MSGPHYKSADTAPDEVQIKNDLKAAVSRKRRCHDRQLQRTTCKAEYRLNSFFPATIRDWNDLPANVVLAPSLDSFKERMSKTGQ